MSDVFAYLILGPTGAGRFELVADLIDGGIDPQDTVVVYYSEAETPRLDLGFFEKMKGCVRCLPWTMNGTAINCEAPSVEDMVFFVTDGTASPVDQVEAFRDWILMQEQELGGVITVVDCLNASKHSELNQWYDACIHFSDTVLLNRRDDVSQGWIREFMERYTKGGRYPCYFEQIKKHRVHNPAEVLDPTPRRITLIFDPADEPLDDMEFDEDDLPEEPFDLTGKEDPFLQRLPSGLRAKVIPDIRKYLD